MQMHPNDTCGSCGPRSPRIRRHWAAWLAAALVVGCGGGELLLVPFFTFGFIGTAGNPVAVRTFSLNLNPNVPTTSEGPFTAPSNITLDSIDQHDVTGTYIGCTFTLAVVNPVAPLAANYNGRFTSADVIVLTPTQGAQPLVPVLTLTRANNGKDTRPTTC